MTYEMGGEQYVAIAPRDGNAVWAFKLGGTLTPLAPPPGRRWRCRSRVRSLERLRCESMSACGSVTRIG